MTPLTSWLLVLLVCALAWLALVVLDGVTEELHAREVADDDRDAAVFATVAEAEADFEPTAQVVPFGPVQAGVVARLPRQRNGEGA